MLLQEDLHRGVHGCPCRMCGWDAMRRPFTATEFGVCRVALFQGKNRVPAQGPTQQ